MSSGHLGDKRNVYRESLYLTKLTVYLANLYFTNLYLTDLRRIQNASQIQVQNETQAQSLF